jgi:CRISPR/Cas system-associated protein Cas10 (large subunit of type III CRISPR-Cas system)
MTRGMMELDAEEHVCQSCGVPVKPEDFAEGSEKGDFCSFCVVHSDRDAVKAKIADRIQDTAGKSREQAEAEAEDTMRGLNRWASD